MSERHRFPAPWSVEETDCCFIVKDRNSQALAFIYFVDEPVRRPACYRVMRRGVSRQISQSCLTCSALTGRKAMHLYSDDPND